MNNLIALLDDGRGVRVYLLATAAVASAMKLCFELQATYESEPCNGVLHNLARPVVDLWVILWASL